MLEKLQYRPLHSADREIRVLEPQSAPSTSTELAFTIRHVSLRDCPTYWTLSYTWGAPFEGLAPEWDDKDATHPISVNGQRVDVQWNLESALKMLRHRNVGTMWIDAICIDQDNVEEKSEQVQMMGDIYRDAVCTLVWLGPDSVDSSLARNGLAKAWYTWRQLPIEMQRQTLISSDLPVYERYARPYLEDVETVSEVNALAHLLYRAWFRRIWIVQEAVLSKLMVFCWGLEWVAQWECLEATAKLMGQHFYNCLMLPNLQCDKSDLVSALGNFCDGATFFFRISDINLMYQQERLSFAHLHSALQPFKASNLKDKVYASLGMFPRQNLVTVDYKLDDKEVYLQFTRAWLETSNNLKALSLCQPSSRPDFPSWAIDFSCPAAKRPLGSLHAVGDSDRIYNAGGKAPPIITFRDDKTLSIRGEPIGIVRYVGSAAAGSRFLGGLNLGGNSGGLSDSMAIKYTLDYRSLQQDWQGEWLRRQQTGQSKISLERYLWTEEPLWEAFARTICADSMDLLSSVPQMSRLGKDFKFTEQDLTLMRRNTSAGDILEQRVFAATDLDQYCLVDEHAQVGDVVFVAIGAETPYLLRYKDGDEFRFVGLCYVHGFMDGEATESMQRSENGDTVGLEFMIV